MRKLLCLYGADAVDATACHGQDINALSHDPGREKQFSCKGVTDMFSPALIRQGIQISVQKDLGRLVGHGEPPPRRILTSKTLPDRRMSASIDKNSAAKNAASQGILLQ